MRLHREDIGAVEQRLVRVGVVIEDPIDQEKGPCDDGARYPHFMECRDTEYSRFGDGDRACRLDPHRLLRL